MTRLERARMLKDNGIVPLQVFYREVHQLPDLEIIGIRTDMHVNSDVLGVLTREQYRVVASRTSQAEELFKRNLIKVVREIPEIPGVFHWISVYVPSRVLQKELFLPILSQIVVDYPKLNFSRVLLEIPADILFKDFDNIVPVLEKAREIGFLIALEDVGNRYCPLLQAQAFHFDYVFLDKELAELCGTEKCDAITGSIIRFFNHFNTDVIACGLKDKEQYSEVTTLGCSGISYIEESGTYPPFISKEEDDDE